MDAVCYRHPEVDAVAVCVACSKPICKPCMLYRQGSIFCSEACAKRSAEAADKVHRELKKQPGSGSIVSKILGILILGGVAVGVLQWLGFIDVTKWF